MATKKISELPLITALSGSQEETLIPVVVGGLNGTTNRITAENFSKFVNAYNATTSSNTFIGAQIINGNLTVTGNQVISGRLTVNELVAQYETASIIFSSGSNKFGDELTDKQEFTGSLDLVGNFILNGAQINNTLDKVHQATGSLQIFTASQDSRNFVISQYTSSTDAHIVGISDFTSSQLIVNTGLASVTASLNNFSGSTNAFTGSIEKTTASIHLATASLNYFYQSTSSLNGFTASQADRNLNLSIVTGSLNIFTASQDDRNFVISQYTASTDAHIVGISQFTSSILSQNAGVASVTASLNAFTASQDSRNFVISQFTSSTNAHIVGISDFTSSQLAVNLGNSIYTASVDSHIVGISDFTSSQLAVNLGNSIYTASVDSHIVGISTYTSSVRDTLARVHQSTASLQQFTASQDSRNLTLSTVTGSLIGITNGLMAFTAALDNTYATDAQLYQLYQATRSIELTTGSLIGITNGLMAFTAALDSTYATDAQLYELYSATASINTTTGSLKGEIAGIEAYTASLKGATLISSSNQIFVNGAIISDNTSQKILATNTNILYLYSGTSGIYINNQANDTTIAQFTNAGQLTIGGPGNDQNLVFGGTNSSIYWGSGGPARMYYNVGDIKISSAGATDVLNVKNIGGILVNGGITGSLMATNGVISSSAQIEELTQIAGIEAYTASLKSVAIVSSSQQIQNYNLFAQTSSANIFYNYQAISGSKLELHTSDANGGFVINSKATSTQTFITLLDRGSNDNSIVATFEDTNGANQLGGLKIEAGRKDNQAGLILKGKNKVANSGAVNGYITSVIGNAYSDNALTTLTTGVTGKSISFLGQDTELANLNFNGDLTITNGNLVVASGKGIDFSANSNAAGMTSELLNDYEEGTWTPTVIGSGTAGTYTLSGTTAYYTKIGNQVTVFANFGFSAASGGTGYVTIGGLPFNYRANNSSLGTIIGINFDYSAGMLYAVIAATSSSSTNNIFIQEVQDNTTSTEGPISGVTTSTSFRFTYTYTVS